MRRFFILAFLVVAAPVAAQEPKLTVKHTKDVIYGRKFGTVLTMDVFAPVNGNGAAVIWCVSGGWFSSHAAINPAYPAPFLKRGYTVFAVVHGSQPKFTIPEILQDMHRATRYIRAHAKDYKVDPERIGITGGSAGGHLSLMQGLAGRMGDAGAKDPVDRLSSRVQAVACFYPPTDFLNYGKPGEDALGRGVLAGFKAPFMFSEYDKSTNSFVLITDEERFKDIGRKIAPINHVSKDDPPTLIMHGDADRLVPIQQAEILIAKLKEAGVPAELAVKKGAGHGWPNLLQDLERFADWFDRHLKKSDQE
ncbi:MAG: alpha/beta hydrolase [Gemmataceae bacterium]|nr:alpha/beta hydrolase [Gemmataceae bacterium]